MGSEQEESNMDVKIPGKLYAVLRDRGAFRGAPDVAAEQRGNRVTLTGPREQLAALGAYIADCAVFAALFRTYTLGGYRAGKLREFAAQFPAEREQAATRAELRNPGAGTF